MRIAYVGNFEPEWSTENDVRIALESMGHDVVCLQENRVRPRVLERSALESELLLWTSTWDSGQPLPETLDTLHKLAKAGIPSAAYHLDTFWQTTRDKRKWWRNPMWRMAHVFTADGDWQHEFELSGIHHHWLPAGIRHTAAVDGVVRDEFRCDVAFVGSHGIGYHSEWPYRYELTTALREMCKRNRWSYRNPGGIHEKIGRADMADFYASAKVTVGDSLCLRREATTYWSDRVYEATGRGGLLIMPEIKLLHAEDQFAGWMPTYPWGDFNQLEEIVGYLLEQMKEHRLSKRPSVGDQRSMECTDITRERHTYVNRMNAILERVIA